MSALHTAVLAAAATVGANSPGRRDLAGGDQPGDGPAERPLADGAALGDPLDLYSAVLRRHLGCTQ